MLQLRDSSDRLAIESGRHLTEATDTSNRKKSVNIAISNTLIMDYISLPNMTLILMNEAIYMKLSGNGS